MIPQKASKPRSRQKSLSHPLFSGLVGVLVGAVLSPLLTPALTRTGNWIADRLAPIPPPVSILACAPLKDSRTLLSVTTPGGSKLLADYPHQKLNDTFIYVENTSNSAIKNVTLTAYPLGFGKTRPVLEAAKAGFTSIRGSANYKISYLERSNTIELVIPDLNPHEAILIFETYFQPVGYVVELYADGLTLNKSFQPGCPNEIDVKVPIQRTTDAYFGPHCIHRPDPVEPKTQQQPNCTVEDNIPFTMTEDMRGQKLVASDLVVEDPIRMKLRALRPDLTR